MTIKNNTNFHDFIVIIDHDIEITVILFKKKEIYCNKTAHSITIK